MFFNTKKLLKCLHISKSLCNFASEIKTETNMTMAKEKIEFIESCFKQTFQMFPIDWVEQLWNKTNGDVICHVEECADDDFTDSDVMIAITSILGERLGL